MMNVIAARSKYSNILLKANPLYSRICWRFDEVCKYAEAIKAERNVYGYEQEIRYWKLAVDVQDYGWTVEHCIRFKEQDVANHFQLMPALYASLSEIYDKVLCAMEEG